MSTTEDASLFDANMAVNGATNGAAVAIQKKTHQVITRINELLAEHTSRIGSDYDKVMAFNEIRRQLKKLKRLNKQYRSLIKMEVSSDKFPVNPNLRNARSLAP